MTKRRKILLVLLGLLFAVGLLAYFRGLRYPPVQWDPSPRPQHARSTSGYTVEAVGAYFRGDMDGVFTFRAFRPDVQLQLWSHSDTEAEIVIENLHPKATWSGDGQRTEVQGVQQTFTFDLRTAQSQSLEIEFPQKEVYRFVAFGDAGGGPELKHCLDRSAELRADFILHLGDIAYQETPTRNDFKDGSLAFRDSPVPVYITCGNHDFHGGFRNRHLFFSKHFGPLNSHFRIGGVDFLNLDTAADVVPPWGGYRGRLLKNYTKERELQDPLHPMVVFTHRPLNDPRVLFGERKKPHALNRTYEANWLRKKLLKLQCDVLLAGHIHHSFDFDDSGLRTIIAGEGLGENGPGAKILVGEFQTGRAPTFSWELLQLP